MDNKVFSDEEILKGVECCTEFLCGECPYNIIQGIADHINIRCQFKLNQDVFSYLKHTRVVAVKDFVKDLCTEGFIHWSSDCIECIYISDIEEYAKEWMSKNE